MNFVSDANLVNYGRNTAFSSSSSSKFVGDEGSFEIIDKSVISKPGAPSENLVPDVKEIKSEIAAARKKDEKDVTFLFYMDGSYQDLEPFVALSLLGLESEGSDENVNIVALLGREPLPKDDRNDFIDNDWHGVREYYVVKNPQADSGAGKDSVGDKSDAKVNMPLEKTFVSPYEKMGSDMHNARCLENFIARGMSKYPAKHTCLIMMGHGRAFQGISEMSPTEVEKSIANGAQKAGKEKVDALFLNSCREGNLELLTQLKDVTDVSVVSEDASYADIMLDWADLVKSVKSSIKAGEEFNPGEFSSEYVEKYKSPPEESREWAKNLSHSMVSDQNLKHGYHGYMTLAAIDSKKLESVVESWGKFVEDWKKSGIPDSVIFDDLKDSRNYPTSLRDFDNGNLRDVGDIARRIQNNPKVPENIRKDCEEIGKSLKNAVINEYHMSDTDFEGSTGVTLWAPLRSEQMAFHINEYINNTPKFNEKTGWSTYLQGKEEEMNKYNRSSESSSVWDVL